MPTRLILIRHGLTHWNLKKRYSGHSDVALNAQGKSQAKRLRERLKRERVEKIYTSDRKRSIQTAEIIFKRVEIEKMPDLREMHFGCFEGLTYKDIMKRHPVIYKKWLKAPFSVTIPEGEGLGNFKKRVLEAFKNIISLNKEKTVAVVCHGGPISIFLNHVLKSKNFWKHIPASASLSIVEFKNGKAKIKLLNDTSHLKTSGTVPLKSV